MFIILDFIFESPAGFLISILVLSFIDYFFFDFSL